MNTKIKSNLEKEVSKNTPVKVAVAMGDGIGPEIMKATLRIMEAAGANLSPEFIELGEKVYLSGNSAGIDAEAWNAINASKLIFKAPVTTPQGKGFKSLNVTLRKSLGLFANVRPVKSLHPYVASHFPELDVVIVRENEEDLYAGIEHQQTQEVVQCLKLITRPGCERIVRYAFEYARTQGRKKVTCMLKDNIMKLTDGLFHKVFLEVAEEYPMIKHEVQIIDIGAARLAAKPELYDVVVAPNLYGDIISDIVAEIAGSVGMAGSANIGQEVAMFEAIHGSAPDIAGKGIANPSGLINAGIFMLEHIGQTEAAAKIQNAWLYTLEEGFHTADIYQEGISLVKLGTQEFANRIIQNLGKVPQKLKSKERSQGNEVIKIPKYERKYQEKLAVGVDVFLDWQGKNPDILGEMLKDIAQGPLQLKMITNRGVKVFPHGNKATFCTDHWRCRFVSKEYVAHPQVGYLEVKKKEIIDLLTLLVEEDFDIIKTENLYTFDGKLGFSLGQGE